MSILHTPGAELVLIAGAGIAGLTLANDLASRGIAFRVIDPLAEPVRESRAHGVLGRTLVALDRLGLVEPMLAAAKQPTPVLREYFGSKLVAETDFAKVQRDLYPLMLPIFQQRGPQADLLLFAGLSPRAEVVEAFGAIKNGLVSLREHLRVRYVFPSQAYASKLGMSENDPDVIVDGLEKLHTAFGIREPEVLYLRPDGYIGLRSQGMRKPAVIDYLGLVYAGPLAIAGH